jgi:two-component system chemotaxis response regulator CheB
MQARDVIVMAGSAGAVEAALQIAGQLPAAFPASIFLSIHIPANAPSVLPKLLRRAGPLPAAHPADGDAIVPGRIYVAPPDRHLLVKRGRVRVIVGPKQNGHRPAADPMFRTAARAYGARVAGVVLTGNLDDGTAGLRAVKGAGGVAIVEDPATALHAGMPRSAVAQVEVDHVLPLPRIAACLVALAGTGSPEGGSMSENGADDVGPEELDEVELSVDASERLTKSGQSSGFTCPECHGGLWYVEDEGILKLRCRVGHRYTFEGLLTEQRTSVEAALWTALRALEENAELARRLLERSTSRSNTFLAARYSAQIATLDHRAAVIREVLDSELLPEPQVEPATGD